ncbi:PE domain-containing protein [Mycobacteroides chelonae]|uniref:PE domain-containing protein n=1 Tax=Mycobacteroides chelonae TaxID=1774 RepID=UPI001C2B958A|nr:PE domain-containing protein [Mycobacteroides chelonae]MBV0920413.1 PE domain-containing protein [Mycobacteroides chelonae]
MTMPLLVETPILAAQGASETAGSAVLGGVLTGVAPALLAPIPMGGEEVSMLLAQAIAANAAQFLAACGVGVAQREALAASSITSAAAHEITDATAAVQLLV